mmetsp:Transcript_73967/g.130912  ORF Transcript_73967/g.130912 Transcript_73967/m.130912 type:complete len:225 (-) Transcript_73967:244-918(-)
MSRSTPPTPRSASAARNLTLASGSSGWMRPVGWTWIHSRSTQSAPTAIDILRPSPVQWSPLVVGRCTRSGRCLASRESAVKSAPKPPVQMITGPYSWQTVPSAVVHSTPQTLPEASVRSFSTLVFNIIFARPASSSSAISSRASMRAYVMVIPGKRSLPRCVRGFEWPPSRDTRLKSRPNLSTSQSTDGALSSQSTPTRSGRLAPPRMQSSAKVSGLSEILSLR